MLRSLNEAVPIGSGVEVVVVVDQAHDHPLPDERGLGLDLRMLLAGGPAGPARARNLGVRASVGVVVAFLDDDVIVPGDWLTGVRSVLDGPWHLVGGTIRSVHQDNLISQMFETLVIRHAEVGACRYLSTANVLIRRSAFELLDGFDERFPDAGEDWDLSRRAHAAGLQVDVTDAFAVHHWNPVRVRELLSRSRRYASSSRIRFAPWRPQAVAGEDRVVRLARDVRVRSPLRLLTAPFTTLLPNFLARYGQVRERGFGRARSAAILLVHLPWFLAYSATSLVVLLRDVSEPSGPGSQVAQGG